MEALCLPEQLSSFHQRTLAQMGKPIIVELFGTGAALYSCYRSRRRGSSW